MPPIGAPPGRLGNRALGGLARRVMDHDRAAVNCAARGAPPVADVTRRRVAEARLVLVAMSPARLLRPDDGPAAVYRERCELLAAKPPPDDWDGVWNLTEK
jgi:hypothetical protein